MFETQKSGNEANSGEIGLDIRTQASPKMVAIDTRVHCSAAPITIHM